LAEEHRRPPLIASSVFHYELEFIHPFSDGNGRIGRLWQTLILSRWKLATHLFYTVSRERTLELCIIFHHLNQDIYFDSLEQHTNEALAHLNSLQTDFLSKLTPREHAIYQKLETPYDDAFRILRDLAHYECDECPPPEFFITLRDLGFRLKISPKMAKRFTVTLIGYGALEELDPGRQRAAGQPGRAARYKWIAG
jgi:Fic family protein